MRVLIADDDSTSRMLLEGTLRRLGHEVVAVTDGPGALAAALAAGGPRLAILDWMMPDVDGLEVCRRIRADAAHYVYVILLTARDRPEDRMAGLDAGADDFLTKPLDLVELRIRLRSGERVVDLQERLLEIQEDLRHEASHDYLTGLWNRRMALDHLERELNRATREQRPIAVAIADLDHFKEVNDRHGHAIGDAVLRAAAARMRSTFRSYDTIGRYGGEEFLIVLPGCDLDAATASVERARQAVRATPVEAGDSSLQITLSVGIAWTAKPPRDSVVLVRAADEALYRAKTEGRDRIAVQVLT